MAAGKEPSKGDEDTSEAGASGVAAPAEKQLSEGEEQPWQGVKGKSKKEKKGNRSGAAREEADTGAASSGGGKAKPREPVPSLASTPKGGVSQRGESRGAEKALAGAGQGLQGEKQDARRSPRDLTPKSKLSVRGAACGGSSADARPQDGEAQPASADKLLWLLWSFLP